MSNKVTDEERNIVCEKYLTGKYSVASLSKECNRNCKTIIKILHKYNIEIDSSKCGRDYTINHNYFDVIDSEEKAYFLGLLYADGCNMKHRSVIKITLQEDDKHILDTLSKCTNSNRPIDYYQLSKKHPKWKNVYTYRINSKRLCDKLESLGCVPRKSLILQFPTEKQVPKHLIRHFVRGYFDGDGSVSSTTGGRNHTSIILQVNITSTVYFLNTLYDILQKELGIHTTINQYKRVPYKPTRMMIFSCNIARKFLEWIYEDAKIYFYRKYNKYIEIERKINDNRTDAQAKI